MPAYGKQQLVTVVFSIDGGTPTLGRAVLIEGYTTATDLPAILGVPRDVPQRQAGERVAIHSVRYETHPYATDDPYSPVQPSTLPCPAANADDGEGPNHHIVAVGLRGGPRILRCVYCGETDSALREAEVMRLAAQAAQASRREETCH